jgi:hypothetical protein
MPNRSETSRLNGAKSKGPVTPEGRERSARNSLKHGLSAEVVVLPHEDKAHFEQLRDSYMDDFQPANQSQHDLVETMAAATWRLNRLVGMEAKIFEEEVILRRKDMEKELIEMTEVEKLAWVFANMANHGKSLQMLQRFESQLNRTYDRAFKQLQALQNAMPGAPAGEIQNEPKSAPSRPQNVPEPAPAPPQSVEKLVPEAPNPEIPTLAEEDQAA